MFQLLLLHIYLRFLFQKFALITSSFALLFQILIITSLFLNLILFQMKSSAE
jgi:hypothetical protein